jgi:hypothetical protein
VSDPVAFGPVVEVEVMYPSHDTEETSGSSYLYGYCQYPHPASRSQPTTASAGTRSICTHEVWLAGSWSGLKTKREVASVLAASSPASNRMRHDTDARISAGLVMRIVPVELNQGDAYGFAANGDYAGRAVPSFSKCPAEDGCRAFTVPHAQGAEFSAWRWLQGVGLRERRSGGARAQDRHRRT